MRDLTTALIRAYFDAGVYLSPTKAGAVELARTLTPTAANPAHRKDPARGSAALPLKALHRMVPPRPTGPGRQSKGGAAPRFKPTQGIYWAV